MKVQSLPREIQAEINKAAHALAQAEFAKIRSSLTGDVLAAISKGQDWREVLKPAVRLIVGVK